MMNLTITAADGREVQYYAKEIWTENGRFCWRGSTKRIYSRKMNRSLKVAVRTMTKEEKTILDLL